MTARLLTVRSGRVHLEGCTRIRTDDTWVWSPANDGPGVAHPCPHCLPDGLPTPVRTTPAEAIAEYTAGVQRARDPRTSEEGRMSEQGWHCDQCGSDSHDTIACQDTPVKVHPMLAPEGHLVLDPADPAVRETIALALTGYRDVPFAETTGDLAWQVWGEGLLDADAVLAALRDMSDRAKR